MSGLRMRPLAVLTAVSLLAACSASTSSPSDATPSSPSQSADASDSAAASESASAEPTPVPDLGRVTLAVGAHVVSAWPLTIAEGGGFFADEGLDAEVVITNSGANSLAAVAGGSANFASLPYSDAILAANEGRPLVAVSSIVNQFTTDAVISEAKAAELGITEDTPLEDRFANVQGMRIGINAPGSGQDKIIRLVLSRYGIDPDTDVSIVGLGNEGMLPAFQAGQVDALLNSSPTTDQAIAAGGEWWFRPSQGELPELDGMTYTALIATPEFVEANPEITEAVVRAMTKAMQFLRTDKAGSLEILSEYSELDAELLEAAYESNLASFPENAIITESQFEQNLEFMTATGTGEVSVSFEDVTVPEFAERLAEELGY